MPAKLLPTKTLLTLLLTTAALLVPAAQSALNTGDVARASQGCEDADVMPDSSQSLRRAQSATLCLLNNERRERGLRALRPAKTLDRSSREYARDMVRQRFFAHVSPGGRTLLQRIRTQSSYLAGTRSYFVGENLAWGSGTRATPRSIMKAWMNSPGHRANILERDYRHLGIGLSTGAPKATSSPAATYVTHFGRRTRR